MNSMDVLTYGHRTVLRAVEGLDEAGWWAPNAMGTWFIKDIVAHLASIDIRRKTGILPWYGQEYDLEDFITYGVYGHKREHSAQIAMARERRAMG